MLYYTTLMLYNTIIFYTILYYTILYYTILYVWLCIERYSGLSLPMVVVGWIVFYTVVSHVCVPCCIIWMILALLRLIRVIRKVVMLVLLHCWWLILWLKLRVLLLQGWCDVLLVPSRLYSRVHKRGIQRYRKPSSPLQPWAGSTPSNVQYTAKQQRAVYYTILYYNILYNNILYYTTQYYTILYYTILYYTILLYTMLY